MKVFRAAALVLFVGLVFARASEPLFLAPLYPEYTSSSDAEFADEVQALRQRLGEPT